MHEDVFILTREREMYTNECNKENQNVADCLDLTDPDVTSSICDCVVRLKDDLASSLHGQVHGQ